MIKRIIYFFLIAITVSSCENDIQAVMEFDSKKAAVENGSDIVAMFSQNGKVSAKLLAPEMERSLDKPTYVEFKKGLKLLMYDTTLQVTSTLTAKHGKYLEEEGYVYLRDSVVLVTAKGETLNTNELNYDPKRKIFYSTKEVFINTPTSQLHGWGLEANEDFSVKKIISVSGPITIEDSTSMSQGGVPEDSVETSATPAPAAMQPAGTPAGISDSSKSTAPVNHSTAPATPPASPAPVKPVAPKVTEPSQPPMPLAPAGQGQPARLKALEKPKNLRVQQVH
ncbi:LPS export ABC transporter periplasmic protein LptC [Chitinophaga sp. Hz27]|uniref:LPS export ABC transporter periplasmic protein LptC n=1 Tax=Chitinophaga sp. Hz27 TaxID=3347169 RepID=UPI0035E31439